MVSPPPASQNLGRSSCTGTRRWNATEMLLEGTALRARRRRLPWGAGRSAAGIDPDNGADLRRACTGTASELQAHAIVITREGMIPTRVAFLSRP